MPPVADPFESESAIREISRGYETAEICATLWEACQTPDNQSSCDLPSRVIQHIDKTVAAQVTRYPGFIRSLHMAPWIHQASTSVAWIANRSMDQHFTGVRACPEYDCCRLANIDRRYAWYAVFNDTPVNSDECEIFDIRGWMGVQSPYVSMVPPRCQAIREAKAKAKTEIEASPASCKGLTRDETAILLKCRRSTVDQLLNQGWLQATGITAVTSFSLNIFDQSRASCFTQRYILIEEICSTLHLSKDLCERLLGAMQVPAVNYFINPKFYRRSDVSAVLNTVSDLRNVAISAIASPSERELGERADPNTPASTEELPDSRAGRVPDTVNSRAEYEAAHRHLGASRLFRLDELSQILKIPTEKLAEHLSKSDLILSEDKHKETRLSLMEVIQVRNALFKHIEKP